MGSRHHPRGGRQPDRAARPDPGAAAFSEDGVDLTLIRWMLGLDPTERLRDLRTGLLLTRFGPLDILSRIGDDRTYADLLPASKERRVGEMRLRVLGLAKLIEIKEQVGRDKVRAMLPVLRRTLELKDP